MMTTKTDFLLLLVNTPRTWRVRKNDGFLRNDECRCPLEAAFGVGRTFNSPLSDDMNLGIVLAADNRPGCDPVLRRELLEACGIPRD